MRTRKVTEMSKKVTAGKDALGDFAPQFAHLNDEVLFGEVWSREKELAPRDRSLITVTALMSSGILDSSLKFHLQKAKENGVTKSEIAEVLTQLAFYSGWPKAWAAFYMAKEVWAGEEDTNALIPTPLFEMGGSNDAFAKFFVGQSYLNMLTTKNVVVGNVTFEPGCRNNWHIHTADKGGGQILLCTDGKGWYQEAGKEARALSVGDVVVIPPNVKHWHGATKDSWFTHLAIEVPGENGKNEWLEPVDAKAYEAL